MKKIAFLLLLVVASQGLIFKESKAIVIREIPPISSPYAGSEWFAGKTYSIVWSTPKTSNAKSVYITLHNASCLNQPCIALAPYTIAQEAPNTGTFAWTVPQNINSFYTGKQYIKIVTNEGSVLTSDIFTVTPTEENTSSITITSPIKGDSWQKGTVQKITWYPGTAEKVYLKLRKVNGDTVRSISGILPNTGSFEWRVPEDLQASSDYQIRLISQDLSQIIDSGAFTISDRSQDFQISTTDSLQVNKGKQTQIMFFVKGTTGSVKWDLKGNVPGMGIMHMPVPLYCPLPDCKINGPTTVAIAGTPTETGIFPFTWVVTEESGKSSYASFKLVVVGDDGRIPVDSVPTQTGKAIPNTLVKFTDDQTVYYITQNGKKLGLPSMQAFKAYETNDRKLRQENTSAPSLPEVQYIKLKGNAAVFKLEKSQKRWISYTVWQRLNLTPSDVEEVPLAVEQSFKQGKDLE